MHTKRITRMIAVCIVAAAMTALFVVAAAAQKTF